MLIHDVMDITFFPLSVCNHLDVQLFNLWQQITEYGKHMYSYQQQNLSS